MIAKSPRIQLADLTSSTGALVLGLGLGLLSADFFRLPSSPFIVLGVLMHGWGMYDKRQLEKRMSLDPPKWSKVLYWICWLSLIGIVIFLLKKGR